MLSTDVYYSIFKFLPTENLILLKLVSKKFLTILNELAVGSRCNLSELCCYASTPLLKYINDVLKPASGGGPQANFINKVCHAGNLPNAKWLFDHGYKLNRDTLTCAIKSGCIDTVNWVSDQGYGDKYIWSYKNRDNQYEFFNFRDLNFVKLCQSPPTTLPLVINFIEQLSLDNQNELISAVRLGFALSHHDFLTAQEFYTATQCDSVKYYDWFVIGIRAGILSFGFYEYLLSINRASPFQNLSSLSPRFS